MNGGKVTIGKPKDQFGRAVRKVEVDGKDVSGAMIAAGAAKQSIAEKRDWCR
jgi:endonuclease YncB( thermonuclease family)